MPLRGSTSNRIKEFHKGKTYARTKRKFGKAKADKQAVAVGLARKKKTAKRKAK